jgi:hypothetical protein
MSAHKNQEAADELEKYLKLDPKAPDADRNQGNNKGPAQAVGEELRRELSVGALSRDSLAALAA